MAKKRKRSALLQKVLIIGGLLIAVQVGVILYFKQSTSPVGIRDAIETEVRQANVKTPRRREVLRLQLALNDYRITNGSLPQNLDELRPKYFDTVPIDPDTNSPFKYTLVGNKFIIGEKKVTTPGAGIEEAPQLSPEELSTQQQNVLIASLSETVEPVSFIYDPTGKRDPFRPFDLAPPTDPASCQREPLTCFQIGQLKLTAVLGGTDQPTATVEDATGKGFIVRKGQKIGPNGGEIIEILPDRVKILESVVDFTGERKDNVVEMLLRTKDSNEGR